jgi:hypothetical protein
MIVPFKKAQGGYTHVLVTIDKFTKWIEYKPIASLTSAKAVEFIQDIIFRFGIPTSIITDLGSNFTSSKFFDFCEQRSIQIKYVSVAHPRANGQVKRANGMILEALRKKVFDKNEKFAGKWIGELPYVVWSLRTQPSRAQHGNTPFFMVYGSEAVLPADLRFGAPRLVFENCWGLVLKCYELRTRQHKVLNVKCSSSNEALFLWGLMDLGRRLMTIRLRRLNLRNCSLIDCIK